MRRRAKRAPWARRRWRVWVALGVVLLLLSPWLVWRAGLKSDVREAVAALREAGVPVTSEERERWLASFPEATETTLFVEAKSSYVPLPFDVVDHMPTFRTMHDESYLYARPYPEERLAAMQEALRLNAETMEILLRAEELPVGARMASLQRSDELIELLCSEACVRAAEGDGAGAVRAIQCGFRYLESTSPVYATSVRWRSPELERLMNALFSAASHTVLPEPGLVALRDQLELLGWEEQMRLATIDWISEELVEQDTVVMDRDIFVMDLLWGVLDRQRVRRYRSVLMRLQAIGLSRAEQEALFVRNDVGRGERDFRYVSPPVHLDVARLGIDVVRYFQVEGRFPETLEELVPIYCESAPRNDFTGEAYWYGVEGTVFEVAETEPKDEVSGRRDRSLRFGGDLGVEPRVDAN